MNQRLLVGSLIVVALLSGAVVAEAEHNYASVADADESVARVVQASIDDGALQVDLDVRNSLNERLRIQYVHVEANRANHTDAASVPYNGRRTLPEGRSSLTVYLPERQLSEDLTQGETVTISGVIAVEVYNDYQFKVPIEPTEVTL